MKIVIQRVSSAKLFVEGKLISAIKEGLSIYVGINDFDTSEDLLRLAKKIVNLRIFENRVGKMDLSVKDVSGEILLISQFTLLANCKKGNRPDFSAAAKPEIAIDIYNELGAAIKELGVNVQFGIFGAHMHIEQDNEGPLTIVL